MFNSVAILILYYILYITKRLVWADNMFCVPEQLVDSDVVALGGHVSLGESP